MTRLRLALLTLLPTLLVPAILPQSAQAGGTEFPGDGTRGLGRGGARAARADDPTIMTRNPAALALMWDDQALLGAHLLLVDACMRPTGAYGWGLQSMGETAFDLGEGPVYPFAQEGDTNLDGTPLVGFANEPYPEVCYEGNAPFLPHLALSNKLSEDLGVGLGFFPPDSSALFQWGNRDGTVDTPNGLRPNPLRYLRSKQNVSYFSALAAAGYRLAPWISVGLGLQWMLVIYEATTWTTPTSGLDPESDVRGDLFGRDLFIPGVITSVHLQPLDYLDVVVGFKWSDRVKSKVKLDITTGAFGTGEVFQFNRASTNDVATVGSSIPTTAHNQPGEVDSPPVWVPQLTLAVRLSDLLKPRVPDTKLAHRYAEGKVEDHMLAERWDVELDAIYYFTSVYDRAQFTTNNAELQLRTVDPDGVLGSIPGSPGDCTERDASNNCVGKRLVKTDYHGKDQITLRLGGDYNVLPGLLALRAGVSYETRGSDPSDLNVLNYMLSRVGMHGGLTVRVANKTDISFGYAHFLHENVALQVFDGEGTSRLPLRYRTAQYNFQPGAGVPDMMNNGAELGGFDGTAGVEIPNGAQDYEEGPYYVNAGRYFFSLDVVSLSVAQHF